MPIPRWIALFCWVGAKIERSDGFVISPTDTTLASTLTVSNPIAVLSSRVGSSPRHASPGSDDGERIETGGDDDGISNDDKEQEQEEPSTTPSFETTSLRIDDGGSNLTDRFKYKVHALMGDYDPTEGVADDEDQDGNIMKALVTFPTQHVFDVVGKAAAAADQQEYADRVKTVVFDTTGDEGIECEVVPRGTKFVKVRCKAVVESTTMINAIYDELGKMESTVMKF